MASILKIKKNRDISTAIRLISMKFGMLMYFSFLNPMGQKNSQNDYFNNNPDKRTDNNTIDPFRLPSTFTPSTYYLSQATLTSLNDLCKTTSNTCAGKFIHRHNQKFIKHYNLTPTQHQILRTL